MALVAVATQGEDASEEQPLEAAQGAGFSLSTRVVLGQNLRKIIKQAS